MSGHRRPCRDERGATAVVVALLLTVLMTMSAFAIDIGKAYTERRHDQNTVDAAVMSGLVEGALNGGSVNDIVAEVRDKVDTTLARTVSDEEWQGCVDAEQLIHTTRDLQGANPTIDPVTDCISFSATFDELRVKLPDQEVAGVFGPALGFANISVNATANANIVNGTGTGGPPFVALSTATQGDFVCLRTSSAKEPQPLANGNGPKVAATFPLKDDVTARPDPCHSTEFDTNSENFGTLLPYRYSNDCSQQNADVELAISIGIDHIMGVFAHGYDPLADPSDPFFAEKTTERFDGGGGCTVAYPNTFQVDSGLNAGGLSCALVSNTDTGCNGVTPRLQQGPYVQSDSRIVGSTHDNTAPWDFMRDAEDLKGFVPDDCVGVASSRANDSYPVGDSDIAKYAGVKDDDWDHYDRFDTFVACLQAWDSSIHEELFTADVGTSARFGFIPQVAEDTLDKVNYVHIEGFLPVFMYRVYVQESGKMCDPADPRDSGGLMVHDAGQAHSCASSNKTIDRLASIIYACGMVPDTLCNKDTSMPVSAGLDIYEFRLSK